MFLKYILIYLGLLEYYASAASTADRDIRKAFQLHDKVCSVNFDPNEGGVQRLFETITGFMLPDYLTRHDTTPYNGFKFLKTYTFKPTSLSSETRLGVALCGRGIIQWQTSVLLDGDVDWNKPFCIYEPQSNSLAKEKASIWRKMWHRVVTAGKPPSQKSLAKDDMGNLHCFKLARRKKYFNRNNSLFFPGSWVGGLFYCDLTNEKKEALLDLLEDDLTISSDDGSMFCTEKNAIPLLPLESDNYGKSWLEFEGSKFSTFFGKVQGFQVTKYVPFLFTPKSQIEELNFKNSSDEPTTKVERDSPQPLQEQLREFFLKTNRDIKSGDPWFAEIDVEEKYTYSTDEMMRMDYLTNRTLDLLNRLALAPRNSVRKYLTGSESVSPASRTAKKLRHYFQRVESKIWERLPVYDKNLLIMSTESERLGYFERRWKNLKINGRKFKHSTY